MRLVLQRALDARVTEVDESGEERLLGAIERGFVVLAGFGSGDSLALPDTRQWQTLLDKVLRLRVFPDADGKMNLGLDEEHLEARKSCSENTGTVGLLLVSQFTLYADCLRGRRPSFTPAAPPDVAEQLYNKLVAAFHERLGERLQCGRFGADMRVTFTNWGPVTILLDSNDF